MWSVLKSQTAEMDQQITEMERSCSVVVSLMDAMYKQHGVVMPEMKDESLVVVSSGTKEPAAASSKTETADDEEFDDDNKKSGMEGCLLLIDYHKKRFQKR